jgi:hypothetical protein
MGWWSQCALPVRVRPRLMQTTTHRIEGAALLPDPGKDLLHHLGFVKDDVKDDVKPRLPTALLLG